MATTIPTPKADDPCPGCGGTFVPYRQATPEEFTHFRDRENPRALPARVDSATPEQIAELGALHVCSDCGYQTRVKPEPVDEPAAASADEPRRERKK